MKNARDPRSGVETRGIPGQGTSRSSLLGDFTRSLCAAEYGFGGFAEEKVPEPPISGGSGFLRGDCDARWPTAEGLRAGRGARGIRGCEGEAEGGDRDAHGIEDDQGRRARSSG